MTNDVDVLAACTQSSLDEFLRQLSDSFFFDTDEARNALRLGRPVPFVTPEDILLAKFHWYRAGGEVSDVQWRDIAGIVRNRAGKLDREYLEQGAAKLSVVDLLEKALNP